MAAPRLGSLAKRLGSALVMLPLVTYLMFAVPIAFEGVVLVFAVLSVRELYRLAEMRGTRPLTWLGLTVTAVMCLAARTVYIRRDTYLAALAALGHERREVRRNGLCVLRERFFRIPFPLDEHANDKLFEHAPGSLPTSEPMTDAHNVLAVAITKPRTR